MIDESNSETLKHKGILLLALIVVGLNLRASILAGDPLLIDLERDLQLSQTLSGIFELLPICLLGIAAPFAPRLAKRMSVWQVMFWFQIVAIIGMIWRSYGGVIGLFGGMILLGLGLGITGSSIPGFVKRNFPDKAPFYMGVYSALLGLSSALAASLSYPLLTYFSSWKLSLVSWSIPMAISVALWWLYFNVIGTKTHTELTPTKISRLFKNRIAWNVSIFYMFRIAAAYFLFTWLTVLLRNRGMSGDDAGFILGVLTLSQIPSSITAHWLASKLGSTTKLITISCLIAFTSCWGLMYLPLSLATPLAIFVGVGIGTIASLGIGLMVERAKDHISALELSGMAQGVGFIGGALTAVLFSTMVDQNGHYWIFCLIFTLFNLCNVFFGYKSAQPGQV